MNSEVTSLFAGFRRSARGALLLPLVIATDMALAAGPTGIARWGSGAYGGYGSEVPDGLTNAVQIVSGPQHTLALKTDGSVEGWGWPITDEATALAVVTDARAISVAVHHGMLLRSNGTIVVWGDGNSGENTAPSGLSNVIAIAVGARHSLAVRSDGTVAAWGANDVGQTNVPAGLSNVVAVDASGDFEDNEQFSVALKSDGTVVAWGSSSFGATNVPAGLSNVVAISAGGYHVLALQADGTVTAWGDTESSHATPPAGLSNVVSIAAGPYHNIAIRSDRTIVTWGNTSSQVLTVPAGLSNVIAASCGFDFSLALVEDPAPVIGQQPQSGIGFVGNGFAFTVTAGANIGPVSYQWRKNSTNLAGQTGSRLELANLRLSDAGNYDAVVTAGPFSVTSLVATLTVISRPFSFSTTGTVVSFGGQPVPAGLNDVVSIAAGSRHGLALRSDGTVLEWGLPGPSGPRIPAGLSNVVAIAAGGEASLALRADGTAVAWSFSPPSFPGSNVIGIAQGNAPPMVLKADGTVASGSSSPWAPPAGLSNVVAVAAGGARLGALKSDGSAVLWGLLGGVNNTIFGSRTDLTAIAVGDKHVMGLRNDGTVLDIPTTPIQPPGPAPDGLSNVVSIAAGSRQSVALRSDGTAVGWNNSYLPTGGVSHVDAMAAGEELVLVLTRWPVILQQPQGLTVNQGASASFSVTAVGVGPLAFQWRKNGTNLPGATSTNLAIAAATVDDLGDYTVVVSNGAGAVTSLVATLNVNTGPMLTSQPKPQTVFAGGRVGFIAAAVGGLPLHYQWRKDGVDLAGETNSTLNIGSAQNSGAGAYTLVVTNSYGSVTSVVATLAVTTHTFSWPAPGTVVGLDGGMIPPGLTNAVGIAGGESFYSLALRNDGTVVEWSSGPPFGPLFPPDLSNVVAISANTLQAAALRGDGTVIGGGPPADLFGVVAIAVASGKYLALKVDGTVVAWVGPGGGQAPATPAGLSNVVAIAAYDYFIALKSDGSAVMWGGIPAPGINPNPNLFLNANDLVAVAAGRSHVMGLRSNGTVLDYFSGNTPTNAAPADLTNVVAIAAGEKHSLALKSDGTIVRWSGTSAPGGIWSIVPAPGNISNVTAIAAGRTQGLLISSDPPAPMLAADREGGQFNLRVPVSVSGYILETATNLSQPLPPGGVATNVLTFDVSPPTTPESPGANAMKFFRLRKP